MLKGRKYLQARTFSNRVVLFMVLVLVLVVAAASARAGLFHRRRWISDQRRLAQLPAYIYPLAGGGARRRAPAAWVTPAGVRDVVCRRRGLLPRQCGVACSPRVPLPPAAQPPEVGCGGSLAGWRARPARNSRRQSPQQVANRHAYNSVIIPRSG